MSRSSAKKKHRRLRRRKGKNWCQVYALRDPDTDEIKYVGQSRQSLPERLGWFVKGIGRKKGQGRSLSPVEKWIDAMPGKRLPVIEPLDEEGVWDVSETVWINRLIADGIDLLNVQLRVPQKEYRR